MPRIFLLLLLISALTLSCQGKPASPRQVAEQFFKKLAAGDEKGLQKLLTGRALATMPRAATSRMELAQVMAAGFKAAEVIKRQGDKAWVEVKLDGGPLAKKMMAKARSMLPRVKDPAQRRQAEEKISRRTRFLAAAFSKATLEMVRQKGRWLVANFKIGATLPPGAHRLRRRPAAKRNPGSGSPGAGR